MPKKEIALTVRCAKLPSKNFHFIFKTNAEKGSTFESRTSNLEWVELIDQPVRIDISSNRLTKVDLTPLSTCKNLEYLSLATNKFESLDLTPLESCKSLRTLDLSHNYLKNIDLSPLVGCKDLRFLYLQENMFKKVNVAPLFQLKSLAIAVIQITSRAERPKVVIDTPMSNKPPNLNDVVYAFHVNHKAGAAPEWLYQKDSDIEYEPKSYRELVREFGWTGVRRHLMAISRSLRIGDHFKTQQVLLSAFGIPELACYDGNLRDVIKLLPINGSYDDGLYIFQTEMVKLLEDQLQQGRSTLYFDVDALATTRGSVLIPLILKRRDNELEEITLFDNKGSVDLLPLWITSYGHKILQALGFGRKVSAIQLPEIEKALSKINHEIKVETVVYDARKEKKHSYSAGNAIVSYVRSTLS